MVTTEKLITAEELWRMVEPQDGSRYELFQGELIQVAAAGGRHEACCAAICWMLHEYAKDRSAGYAVSNNTGVLTERDPDTVLAPDLAYWSRQHLAELPEGFAEVPPDLAVEVVSPGDSQSYVHRKVLHYLDHGVALVWIVDPKTRTVTVYRSRQDVCILAEAEEIAGGDILPGFSCRVGEFFE
jgi:Uma2 family endonuclease